MGNYQLVNNFPLATPEVQPFALSAAGLPLIALTKIVRGQHRCIAQNQLL
jgi:hypothetical protein